MCRRSVCVDINKYECFQQGKNRGGDTGKWRRGDVETCKMSNSTGSDDRLGGGAVVAIVLAAVAVALMLSVRVWHLFMRSPVVQVRADMANVVGPIFQQRVGSLTFKSLRYSRVL